MHIHDAQVCIQTLNKRVGSQFSQGGEQGAVSGIPLQVICDGLNDGHVIVKLSGPFTDQRGKTLLCKDRTVS